MTYKEIFEMIESFGLPSSYHHFSEGRVPPTPYIVFYYPNSNDDPADNINFGRIRALTIELYTDNKRFDLEESIEAILASNTIPFEKSEAYIDSEHMYQIVYETEMVINDPVTDPDPEVNDEN